MPQSKTLAQKRKELERGRATIEERDRIETENKRIEAEKTSRPK
ncbi:MAG: hypothetical protein AB1427_04405 [Thermodesulfobacteriota bacterium]